jgi:hypothetical protein
MQLLGTLINSHYKKIQNKEPYIRRLLRKSFDKSSTTYSKHLEDQFLIPNTTANKIVENSKIEMISPKSA